MPRSKKPKTDRRRVAPPVPPLDVVGDDVLATAHQVQTWNGYSSAMLRRLELEGLEAQPIRVGLREKRYVVREIRVVRGMRFAGARPEQLREAVRLMVEARRLHAPILPTLQTPLAPVRKRREMETSP